MARLRPRSNLPALIGSRLPSRLPTRVPRPKLPRLPDPSEPDVFEEMTLQEHLEELRSRVVKVSFTIGLSLIAGWFLSDPMMKRLRDTVQIDTDSGGFDTLNPGDPLTQTFKVAMYIAIAISLPVIVYQLIAFLAPGLTRKEKRFVYISLPFVSLLFFAGVAFAFFLAAPRALDFLANFRSDIFETSPTAEGTITFYLTLMIGLGLAFQLPVVMFVIAKLGIVSPARMAQYRRYAAIGIMILSAIITPTTDPFNMAFIFIPLYILYEGGILIARFFAVPRTRAEANG